MCEAFARLLRDARSRLRGFDEGVVCGVWVEGDGMWASPSLQEKIEEKRPVVRSAAVCDSPFMCRAAD